MAEVKLCSLTQEDFIFLESVLISFGFTRITRKDKARTFARLQMYAPRELTGSEVGFEYSKNGYTVVVWTSYLEEEGKWRDVATDAAWVLIREGDAALYFAKPFKRVSSMLLKLLRYAWVSQWKVKNRPLCRKCSANMHISRRSKGRGYYWACNENERHDDKKPVYEIWDYRLPPIASGFVEIRREFTKKYKERNAKQGIERVPAAMIRKPWPIKKPENKEPR